MKDLIWCAKSEVLANSIRCGELTQGANGGNSYDFQASQVLKGMFNVRIDASSVYTEADNIMTYWLRLSKYKSKATIQVMEPYPIVFGQSNNNFKVAIIHHIETELMISSVKHRWFYKRLIKRLSSMDKVVTVSKFWENYLRENGCNNLVTIYNSFNPSDYEFTEDELNEFCTRHGFSKTKPLVYIGNAGNRKGVHQVYDRLKHQDFELVMTGGRNDAKDIPVKYLNLSATDYRKLLASCNVVLAMSRMMEGWNRIAHEAMLCKVPVVGSGQGGMMELLVGGQQIVCTDHNNLIEKINQAIARKKDLGNLGYLFVKRFDLSYFKNSWHSIFA